MAKCYRIIPNTVVTTLTSGYIFDVSEDLLYSLGYMSYDEHNFKYFGTYDVDNKLNSSRMKSDLTRDYIFFFNSPWSCFECLRFFDEPYTTEIARILEYEIPDNIVNASSKGFTNYDDFQAKGIIVPMKLLQGERETFTEFSSELRTQLEKVALQDTKESIEKFSKSVQECRFSRYKTNPHAQLDFLTKFCLEPSRMEKVNNCRFRKSGTFFKSDIITGKSTIITKANRELISDISCGQRKVDDLSGIIRASNGILTLENFREWDGDPTIHTYGKIISYD